MSQSPLRRVLLLAGLGATFGTLFDWAHVMTGVIVYPHPTRLGIAWWVPLLYTGASLAIGLTHPAGDAILRRKARFAHTPLRLAIGFFGLCAVWFASGALPFSSPMIGVALAAMSIGLFAGLDRTWQGALQALFTALMGCGVEIVLSHLGAFSYRRPDVFGIALWLPFIYVAASVGLGNVGRYLAERERVSA